MNQRTRLAAPVNVSGRTVGGGQILPGPAYAGLDFPGYTPAYDPSTMAMLPGYESFMDMNSPGFRQFSQEAMRKGPSGWALLSKDEQNALASDAREKASRLSNASVAEAAGNLAAQGGLSSGARERLQQAGMKNYLDMAQNSMRGANLNKMNIGIEDERQRIAKLSSLPGMEMGRIGAWQNVREGDLRNQINETGNLNRYNQTLADMQMRAIANQQQANAIANSGGGGLFGGGGFLGLGI